MKQGACQCGQTFLIPNNDTEQQVLFNRERPLELVFAGVDVGIKRGFLFQYCSDCSKRKSLEIINPYVKYNGEMVVVDWGEYIKNPSRYINNILVRLDIFSGNAEGHWIVMSQTKGCINPMLGRSVNLYFTSPDDALCFARVSKKKQCHIMRIDDVIRV